LRMRVMSLYELATSGGFAIGVVLGGFAWDRFGRQAYALLAVGYLVVAVCMFMVPKVNQVIERSKLKVTVSRYWKVLRTPRLFILYSPGRYQSFWYLQPSVNGNMDCITAGRYLRGE